ncbi:pre-mRNA-splicing factor CWC22 homolog [Scaptodrosophila lebanonensis]|uniref:Pre-mRNA-splicing factor CWC22 homolog n=1 Tax=Drosophila lebanonensis TaxID=7225 RepID=A0A6J2TQP3_DROLE|nr:pre-mRNA-splicing factor CWC22 homolog [Scaptodrosophila lebanonensis]
MRNRCLLALAAIVWLSVVSAETRIEVDENGDEFELKRFYIQGRQLTGNGSKSQCIVTRRKRSGRSNSVGAVVVPSVSVSSPKLSVSDGVDAQMMEHREGVAIGGADGDMNKRRYVQLTAVSLNGQQLENLQHDDEEDDDEDGDDDEEDADEDDIHRAGELEQGGHQSFVPAALALPLADSSATQLPQGISVVASAATHANVGGDAGIVVVHSRQPPKVNPDTHAVFELKPVQADEPPFLWDDGDYDDDYEYGYNYYGDEDDYEEDDYENDQDFPERFNEHVITEDSPVSTTAIWSTGDGDDGDIHPEVDDQPSSSNDKDKDNTPVKKQRPSSSQSNAVSSSASSTLASKKKKKRRPSSSSSVSSSSSSSSPNKRNKKKSTKKSKKKKKKTTNSIRDTKRRRQPSGLRPMGGNKRRRPQQPYRKQKRRRQQYQKYQQNQQRRRRRRNKYPVRAQYFDNEPIVNCIYINKDPTTTTTPRPFWNILGRDADSKGTIDPAAEQAVQQAVRRNGDFGARKRANLRFVG